MLKSVTTNNTPKVFLYKISCEEKKAFSMSKQVGLFIDSLTSYHEKGFLRHKEMQHYSSSTLSVQDFPSNKTAEDLKLRKYTWIQAACEI